MSVACDIHRNLDKRRSLTSADLLADSKLSVVYFRDKLFQTISGSICVRTVYKVLIKESGDASVGRRQRTWFCEKSYSEFSALYSAAARRGFSPGGQGYIFPSKRWFGHNSVVKEGRKKSFDILLASFDTPEMRGLLFDFLADSEEAGWQGNKAKRSFGRSQSMPVPSLTVEKPSPSRSFTVPHAYSLSPRTPSMLVIFGALAAVLLASAVVYSLSAELSVMHSDLEGRPEELTTISEHQNESWSAEQEPTDVVFVPNVPGNILPEGDKGLRISPAMQVDESPSMEAVVISSELLLPPSTIKFGAPLIFGFFLARRLSEWSLSHPCVVISLVTVAIFVLDSFSCELFKEEQGSLKSVLVLCRESSCVSSLLLIFLQLSRDWQKSRRGG